MDKVEVFFNEWEHKYEIIISTRDNEFCPHTEYTKTKDEAFIVVNKILKIYPNLKVVSYV